jgi:small subunit ribosomal protein S19e
MTTVYDVPADLLIKKLTEKLKAVDVIKPPDWAHYVKTGVHCEKPPVDRAWWYTRVAAIFRKVYLDGPIGVLRLRAEYGGKRDRGSKPNAARKGSGSIIRESLQQLEQAGYVETVKGKGRVVSSRGRALLDNTAHEVLRELIDTIPELGKY